MRTLFNSLDFIKLSVNIRMQKYFRASLVIVQAFALKITSDETTEITQCPSTDPALWLAGPATDFVNPEEERECDTEDEQNDFSECSCVPAFLVDWDKDPKYKTDITPLGVDRPAKPWLANAN